MWDQPLYSTYNYDLYTCKKWEYLKLNLSAYLKLVKDKIQKKPLWLNKPTEKIPHSFKTHILVPCSLNQFDKMIEINCINRFEIHIPLL